MQKPPETEGSQVVLERNSFEAAYVYDKCSHLRYCERLWSDIDVSRKKRWRKE
jgi:hypothetical protein